jgi:hypothetical protein
MDIILSSSKLLFFKRFVFRFWNARFFGKRFNKAQKA